MRVSERFGSSASFAVFARAIFFQDRRERRQRMASQFIKSEQLLFVREQFVLRPFRQIADALRHRRRFFLQRAEERALSLLPVQQNASPRGPACARFAQTASPPVAEAIARAGFNQGFQRFSPQRPAIHALAQFGKRS